MSAPVHFKKDGIDELILVNANSNIPDDIKGGFDAPLAILEDNFPIGSEDHNVFYFKSVGNSFFQRGKPLRWTAGITIDL